jgi:hypothetical protein
MIASMSCPNCSKPHVGGQGKDELILRTEKPTAKNGSLLTDIYTAWILKEVIFTNPKVI